MSNWKDVLKAVAPTIATVLGGPLAGAAVSALSQAVLGKTDGKEEDIAAVVAGASPDVLLKIKEADAKLKLDLANAGIRLEEIAAQDRASARQREVEVKDQTPRHLAWLVLLGFFSVLGVQAYMALTNIIVPAEVQRTLDISLGVLFAMVLAVKDYYFGTSASSSQKNDMLQNLINRQ